MESDSEDELPEIPYTSVFSTKRGVNDSVPAWARSRSRSGGRGAASAEQGVSVGSRSRSGGRGAAAVTPEIAKLKNMKTVHLEQYSEEVRDKVVDLETYREENKHSEEKIETIVIESGVWNANEYVLEVSQEDSKEEESENKGDSVQMPIYVEAKEVDEQYVQVSKAANCDHIYASNSNLPKKRRAVKVNKDEAVKKIKNLEDQKNHNDAEFAKKIKKFRHNEYTFHVCSCGKKFVTVNSARAHAVNKCNKKMFIRSGVHCKCLLCNISFKSKKERSKHVKKQHPLSFPCAKCGQKFTRKKAWNRHIKACKIDMKSYQCNTCMYSTNWRGNLFKHKKTHKKKKLPAVLFQPREVNKREEFGRGEEDVPKDLKNSNMISIAALDTRATLTVVANDKMITVYTKSCKSPGTTKLKSLSMPFPVFSMAAMGSKLALCSSTGQFSILAFTHRGDIMLEMSKAIILKDTERVIKTLWIKEEESILGVVTNSGIKVFDLQYEKKIIVFLHAFAVPASMIVDASLTKTDLQIESEKEDTVDDALRWLDGTVAAIKQSVPGTYCFIDGQSSTHLLVKLPVGVKDLIIKKTGEEVYSVASLQVSFFHTSTANKYDIIQK